MCLFMATETLTKTRRVGRMVLKELEGQQGLNATKRFCMHVWNSQIKIHLKIHAVPIHECLLHPMIPLIPAGCQALFTSALVRIAAFVSLSLRVFLRGESIYSAPILQSVLAETGGTYLFFLLWLIQGSISSLLEENLLHFSVLQVVQLSDSIFCPLYEVNEDPWWPLPPNEVMLIDRGRNIDGEQALSSWAMYPYK